MDMLAHCTSTVTARSEQTIFQPYSRVCLPPNIMTTKATMVASSMITAKDMKKPTLLHILQNVGSRSQSLYWGKGSQPPVIEEHRLWRPYV
jgi:hypothetical protein